MNLCIATNTGISDADSFFPPNLRYKMRDGSARVICIDPITRLAELYSAQMWYRTLKQGSSYKSNCICAQNLFVA